MESPGAPSILKEYLERFFGFNPQSLRYYHAKGMWKLHLILKPENFKFVRDWLLNNSPYSFKGPGASGQEDKIFTIYIGRLEKAMEYAEEIEKELAEKLELADVSSDLFVTPHVAARFQCTVSAFLEGELEEVYDFSRGDFPIYFPLPDDRIGVSITNPLCYGTLGVQLLSCDEMLFHKAFPNRKIVFSLLWRTHVLCKKLFGGFYDDGKLDTLLKGVFLEGRPFATTLEEIIMGN